MSNVPISHRTAGSGFSWFWVLLSLVAGAYLLFIVSLLAATATYARPGDLLRAMESGAITLLPKPLDLKQLARAARMAVLGARVPLT